MWTRRRLVGIGLSLLALSGMPRRAGAQAKKSNLPVCPEKEGAAGDWRWDASRMGWEVHAQNWKLVERGLFVGNLTDPFLSSLRFGNPLAVAGGPLEFNISIVLFVSRQPNAKQVTVNIRAGRDPLTKSMPREAFKKQQKTGHWEGLFQANNIFENDQGAIAESREIFLDFHDGTSTLCKFSLATSGFAAAVRAAETEYKSIKSLWQAGRCEDPPGLPCYLTTLCVETLGLTDDCYELKTLRNYRDNVLLKTTEGTKIIEEYYSRAPALVSAIKESRDESWFLRFYISHLLPCVLFANLRLDGLCLWRHRDMMRKLESRYAL